LFLLSARRHRNNAAAQESIMSSKTYQHTAREVANGGDARARGGNG